MIAGKSFCFKKESYGTKQNQSIKNKKTVAMPLVNTNAAGIDIGNFMIFCSLLYVSHKCRRTVFNL